ncbi:hypothetical protein ACM66B_004771 [Microbotryomycetes sp. NB124-2]
MPTEAQYERAERDRSAMYVDVSELMSRAIKSLRPGETVKHDNLTLMDLMSASEIMEPRTDSYLTLSQPSEAGSSGQAVPFDCMVELLPHELVWIVDELVRRETTFHDGHPLAWTLLTCKYLRAPALDNLASSDEPMHVILKALLMGTIKSTEIVWEELAKAQIYEHEDVHLNMATINFTDLLLACQRYPMSKMVAAGDDREGPIVTVDEVIHELSSAMALLSRQSIDEQVKSVIAAHVTLRLNIVYSLALLTSPSHTSPSDIQHYLSLAQGAIERLRATPRTKFAPRPLLLAVYALGTSAPLPSPQPPKNIPPFAPEEAWTRYDRFVKETQSAVELWQAWDRRNSWATLQEYFSVASRRNMLPYTRSIHQSLILTGQTVFATSTVLSISFAFFHDMLGIDSTLWTRLQTIRETETTWDAPARRVLGWVERVGIQLVTLLWNKCQNRARGRRLIVKGFKQLLQLADEVQVTQQRAQHAIGSAAHQLLWIKPAIEQLVLFELAEVFLSGFEMEMYEPSEWSQVWWVAGRLLARARQALDEIENSPTTTPGVKHRSQYADALSSLCQASVQMAELWSSEPAKTATPFLTNVDPAKRDFLRFEQRFGWLSSASEEYDVLRDISSYRHWLDWTRPSSDADVSLLVEHGEISGLSNCFLTCLRASHVLFYLLTPSASLPLRFLARYPYTALGSRSALSRRASVRGIFIRPHCPNLITRRLSEMMISAANDMMEEVDS